jgi:hypothetical protein
LEPFGDAMSRKRILTIGAALALIRLVAFAVLASRQTFDAQWQLNYLPLWVADFPLSLVYHFLPFPLPEAIIGPLWWLCVGLAISFTVQEARRHFGRRRQTNA